MRVKLKTGGCWRTVFHDTEPLLVITASEDKMSFPAYGHYDIHDYADREWDRMRNINLFEPQYLARIMQFGAVPAWNLARELER